MSSFIVENNSARSVVTVTAESITKTYNVEESNANGMDVLKNNADEDYWLKVPVENNQVTLYPMIRSPYPL